MKNIGNKDCRINTKSLLEYVVSLIQVYIGFNVKSKNRCSIVLKFNSFLVINLSLK